MSVNQGFPQVIHRACNYVCTDFKWRNLLIYKYIVAIIELLTELTTTTVYINTTYKEQ